MKIKWTWFIFAPLFVVMAGFKAYQTLLMPDGASFLGMNNTQLTYFIVIIGAVMFLLCMLINLADKETADILPYSRSAASGVFSLLMAASVVMYSVMDIYGMYLSRNYALLWLISDVCGIIAAISFITGAAAMFTGKSNTKGISVLYLLPAVWSASMLIATFSQLTWLSVRSSDVTIIVAYVFQTLFLFYQAEALVSYREKDSVKKNFVFGLPAVALLTVCAISYTVSLVTVPGVFTISGILLVCQLIIMTLYILSFLIHATPRVISCAEAEQITEQSVSEHGELTEEEKSNFREVTDILENEEQDGETFTLNSDTSYTTSSSDVSDNSDVSGIAGDSVISGVGNTEQPVRTGRTGFSEANERLDQLLGKFKD